MCCRLSHTSSAILLHTDTLSSLFLSPCLFLSPLISCAILPFCSKAYWKFHAHFSEDANRLMTALDPQQAKYLMSEKDRADDDTVGQPRSRAYSQPGITGLVSQRCQKMICGPIFFSSVLTLFSSSCSSIFFLLSLNSGQNRRRTSRPRRRADPTTTITLLCLPRRWSAQQQ